MNMRNNMTHGYIWILMFASVFLVSLFVLPSVSAVPPDDNGDGCLSISEISSYVASWLSGQITIQQVASGVSWWLGGCQAANNLPLHSAAQTLTWPRPIINDGLVGAESNPTGDPIGGYYGYRRIVKPEDADYIVHNRSDFIYLFTYDDYYNTVVQPGQIVYVADDAEINLTGLWNILHLPANVTLASGRGRDFSKGALIYNHQQAVAPANAGSLFTNDGPGVRITGLRIEGPDKSTMLVRDDAIDDANEGLRDDNISGSYYDMRVSVGVYSRYAYLEIDNCEFSGWSAAIANVDAKPDFGGSEPVHGWGGSENSYIHHNYIHHNAHDGWGYGISIGGSSRPWEYNNTLLVVGNLFDFNRHAVTASSEQYSSYEAMYNLVLPVNAAVAFDRHGGGGLSGTYTQIHHNTDRYSKESRSSIGIGNPGYPPGIAMAYNNWAYAIRNHSISSTYPEILIFNNSFGPFPQQGVVLPTAVMGLDKDYVAIDEAVTFSASGSIAGSAPLSYACWNFGDLSEEECGLIGAAVSHSYDEPGRYTVKLTVFDRKGILDSTMRSIVVKPNNPDRVILSFWMRDSYNEHNTNDSSGYFTKSVLIDNVSVWSKDVNSDGWHWEHVVLDITDYVHDSSVLDFQIKSLQDYQRQIYPSYHPFDFFEIYIDDIYIFNRDYDPGNFGDWEADAYDNGYIDAPDGQHSGSGVMHFYNEGGEDWWLGSVMYDDKVGGDYAFMIRSGYRENSISGSKRGMRQTILAPKVTPLLDITDNFGSFRDTSGHMSSISFAGTVDSQNNEVLDFYGHSKKLNGNDNHIDVSSFGLSSDWVLDMNTFLPHADGDATLMYASNGANSVHVYYSPTDKVIIDTGSAQASCDLPSLTHDAFNHILVGKSCIGGNCVLSCANNGVVNAFDNQGLQITLPGASSISFGGYSGGTSNMFGAIKQVRVLKGPLPDATFTNESKSVLQGSWYLRDNTGATIRDGSMYNEDIPLPAGLSFGNDGLRKYLNFDASTHLTIPRDPSQVMGDGFSVELVARFDDLSEQYRVVDGTPYVLYNEGWIEPGWPSSNRIELALELADPNLRVSDPVWQGWRAVRTLNMLADDKWYHLVFTKNGDYLRSYVNGHVARSLYIPGISYDGADVSDLVMGGFDGDIERFSVFDKALTDSEVEALYESSLVACSDSDGDGYGVFPRSGVVNGCRLDGFDCDDSNAGVGAGVC